MKAFINGMGVISPQLTWERRDFLLSPVDYSQNYLQCIEPEYEQLIPAQFLRRMSRILRIGTSAGIRAVREAGVAKPDAIIAGTGYGCLEDTATFLSQISDQQEQALNPTPFMQSTHNTIASQIALILQCMGYNQTYGHGTSSFEHALLDSMMHLSENPSMKILAGGVDEWTPIRHAVESRFSKYRKEMGGTLQLLQSTGRGTVAGEGAAFFVLSGTPGGETMATINGVRTFVDRDSRALAASVTDFLRESNMNPSDVDLLLTGKNGDHSFDTKMDAVINLFQSSSIGGFKHLCGEYSVASSFAVSVAATILQREQVPDVVFLRDAHRMPCTVLIHNSYFNDQHALILLQRCHPGKK